jgi:hypothetical protein
VIILKTDNKIKSWQAYITEINILTYLQGFVYSYLLLLRFSGYVYQVIVNMINFLQNSAMCKTKVEKKKKDMIIHIFKNIFQ